LLIRRFSVGFTVRTTEMGKMRRIRLEIFAIEFYLNPFFNVIEVFYAFDLFADFVCFYIHFCIFAFYIFCICCILQFFVSFAKSFIREWYRLCYKILFIVVSLKGHLIFLLYKKSQ
jgi:hypothetical protein